MKTLFTFTFCLILFVATPLEAATACSSSAQEFADRFYRTVLNLQIRGLPTESQMKTLSPFLSDDLVVRIESARKEQARFIKEHPDEKPPWIEGDLFSSLFEGFTSYNVGSPKKHENDFAIPIKLQYHENKTVLRWEDLLILNCVKGEWKVWDILFNGKWEFKSGESLRQVFLP
jgi:hypothetical protein